jgi:hypothetical protein
VIALLTILVVAGAPIVAALFQKSLWWLAAAILVAAMLYAAFRATVEGEGLGILEAEIKGQSIARVWITRLFFCFTTCAVPMLALFATLKALRGLLSL